MSKYIPYGRQTIEDDDIKAVVKTLKSDFITTGPQIDLFEKKITKFCGAKYGVAVSSGTAALHAAMYAIGIGEGDEVIVPSMTFAATANAVVFQGGTPVFCDVSAETMLIDVVAAEKLITKKTKAIIAVDFAGQPCRYNLLKHLASKYNLIIIADACHSIGAIYDEEKVGSTLADITLFSFHPVKHITTGEGGMLVTDKEEFYQRAKIFRNHGITTDYKQREENGSWFYEMVDLGYNYRITDIQCALGISQLKKLPSWLKRRNEIAKKYNDSIRKIFDIAPLKVRENLYHAYHLYVVNFEYGKQRNEKFNFLREKNIGVNVHYIPVHLHPFYQNNFNTHEGLCPVAEILYKHILSLPIFPTMTDEDVDYVVEQLRE
jgi:perosamine synthetase